MKHEITLIPVEDNKCFAYGSGDTFGSAVMSVMEAIVFNFGWDALSPDTLEHLSQLDAEEDCTVERRDFSDPENNFDIGHKITA